MAATAVLGIGLAYGIYQNEEARKDSRKAARAQEEANRVQTAQQQVQDIAKRRQTIREERVRRAQILNLAQQQGVAGSSGAVGAVGSLSTSVASQGAAIRAQQNTANAVSALNIEASKALVRSQEHQALSSLSFQFANFGANQIGTGKS